MAKVAARAMHQAQSARSPDFVGFRARLTGDFNSCKVRLTAGRSRTLLDTRLQWKTLIGRHSVSILNIDLLDNDLTDSFIDFEYIHISERFPEISMSNKGTDRF
jgi:hypothetical protein